MKMSISISRGWFSATVRIGSCVREYSLPGGFTKYRLVDHLRRVNYLDKTSMTFDSSLVGWSALYAYVTKYSPVNC